MKYPPLRTMFLVAAILLTFSAEKVFPMGGCLSRKISPYFVIDSDPVREEAKNRFLNNRSDDQRGDASGAASRGVLGSGREPSEELTKAQDNDENETTSEAASSEEHSEEQISRLDTRELTFREQVYLYLEQMEENANEAKNTFSELGRVEFSKGYEMVLIHYQQHIDDLKSILQKAEEKEPSEQESAFKMAYEEAENKCAKANLRLDQMIEDVRKAHKIRQWMIYRELNR